MRTPISIGVVGDGPGAKTIADAFSSLPQADLRWVCEDLAHFERSSPWRTTSLTHDFDGLLRDEELDAVAFASTGAARGRRAFAALAAGKHVLVAAPVAFRAADADELITFACRQQCRLEAYSPWLFRPGVERLRGLVELGTLGEILHLDVVRHAPSSPSAGDLLWRLAYGSLDVALNLLRDEPIHIDVRPESIVDPDRLDLLEASLEFATGITAHVQVSRVHAMEVDRLVLVGSRGTALLEGAGMQRLSFAPLRGRASFAGGMEVSAHDCISFGLEDDATHTQACAAFVAAVRSPAAGAEQRRAGADVLAVVETLARASGLERSLDAAPELPTRGLGILRAT